MFKTWPNSKKIEKKIKFESPYLIDLIDQYVNEKDPNKAITLQDEIIGNLSRERLRNIINGKAKD